MTDRRDRYRDMIDAGRSTEPQAPREAVGDTLRLRREELGYDLVGVANVLRIRRVYLEAIEDGRHADLPGQAYILGFLRSYADLLGLDSGELLNRFKDETAGRVMPAELYLPIPVSENRVPSGVLMVAAVALAAVLYGGWYLYSAADRSALNLVPKLPERLTHLTGGGDASPPPANVLPAPAVQALLNQAQPTAPEVGAAPDAAAPLADAVPGPVPVAPQASATPPAGQTAAPPPAAPGKNAPPSAQTPVAQAPAPAGAAASEAPDDEAPQMPDLGQPKAVAADTDTAGAAAEASMRPDTTAPGAAPAPAKGRVFGQTGPARVVVRATDETWIQVRDAKGTLWASRVLHPGDSFRAPDVPGLSLETGNAGGLVISLDGKDLPTLGAKGQVVRSYPLQPDDIQARVTH